MSFYPRLLETINNKVVLYNKGGGRKFITDKLISDFNGRYGVATQPKRIRNNNKVSLDTLINDIKILTDKYELNLDKNSIHVDYKRKEDGGLSNMYPTVFFTIDGQNEKFAFAGKIEGEETTQTSTEFKEGMVVYFYNTKKDYVPFAKDDENKYFQLINNIKSDIRTDENSVKGLEKEVVNKILHALELDSEKFSQVVLYTIFNAMSIGNNLKKLQIKKNSTEKWEIYRDKEFFEYIKNTAAKDIGFKRSDKWTPMDIVLVEPGKKQEVLDTWEEAKNEKNEELKLGLYNSVFVDEIGTANEKSVMLGISLKLKISRSGKGKSYLDSVEKFKEKYNITKNEKSWETNKLIEKIIELRTNIDPILQKNKISHIFNYAVEKPVENIKKINTALSKYGALKMLTYLLENTDDEKNIFVNLAAYSLSLGKNPTFFKFTGDDDGYSSGVKQTKYEAKGGVRLYDIKAGDIDNYDGKILITDSNSSMAIIITYYIVIASKVNFVKMSIRSQGSTQVYIEIDDIDEVKDLTESFYPRINEKFVEDSDPIADMKIGISSAIEKYIKKNDHDDSVREGFLTKAQFIINAEDLNKNTKKAWIEYLLSKGNEDLLNWEEDNVFQMEAIGVDFFPNLENLPYDNIYYKYKNGKYILYADEWYDFTLFFRDNREITNDTIGTILSGESNDMFYTYYPDTLHAILDFFNEKEKKQILGVLLAICEEQLNEKMEEMYDLSKLFYFIEHDKRLQNIKGIIINTIEDLKSSADESEAFNDITRAIERHFKLNNISQNASKLVFEISKQGLNKLFTAYWNEDRMINYYPPQYGWQGDISAIDFLEEIKNNT